MDHAGTQNAIKNSSYTHVCPEIFCGERVRCEVEQGKGTCWCFSVNPTEGNRDIVGSGEACLCKACLTGDKS